MDGRAFLTCLEKCQKTNQREGFTLELIYLRETELKVTHRQTEELDGATPAAGLNCQQMLRREHRKDTQRTSTSLF